MSRPERHQLIKQLIRAETVTSQVELAERLGARGFACTQSGLSRDLREIGVLKSRGRYQLPEFEHEDLRYREEIAALFVEGRPAGPNLLVVETLTGGASRLALHLDRVHWPEVVGTIAGDDTIFVATASKLDQSKILRRLRKLVKEGNNHD